MRWRGGLRRRLPTSRRPIVCRIVVAAAASAEPAPGLCFVAGCSHRIDGRRILLLHSDRIRELEARLVAHGIVLKTIARLLSDSALAELKAAAQSIDDAGMQESNPDLHLRRVAEEMWSILEMVG